MTRPPPPCNTARSYWLVLCVVVINTLLANKNKNEVLEWQKQKKQDVKAAPKGSIRVFVVKVVLGVA